MTVAASDAWRPQDALLLPLRDRRERLLGLLCVNEPLSGRRPSDEDVEILMAVADHTGLLPGAAGPPVT